MSIKQRKFTVERMPDALGGMAPSPILLPIFPFSLTGYSLFVFLTSFFVCSFPYHYPSLHYSNPILPPPFHTIPHFDTFSLLFLYVYTNFFVIGMKVQVQKLINLSKACLYYHNKISCVRNILRFYKLHFLLVSLLQLAI